MNNDANTLADVTGLAFPVAAGGTYWFRFVIPYTSAATTNGSRWTLNGPATTMLTYASTYSLSATANTTNPGLSAYGMPTSASTNSTSTTANMAVIEGVIKPSESGEVTARFASELAGRSLTAKAGASVQYQAL